MNNGRPPYGKQTDWGQQGYGQQPGYAPQQPQPNQMNPQSQPPMNQPQRPAAPQQPYPGYPGYMPQQGYAPTSQQMQQQRYPQQQMQQTPYQQMPQQSYPQQGYGQQQRYGQQPVYQQSYAPQQPGQRYWPQQQPYPAQQQVQPQSYIGYQPPKPKKSISPEMIALMIIGGILPVLFILGLVLPGAGALKWVFMALTLVMIAYIWVRPVVKGNLRLILSLVGGAMAIIALVSALTASAPNDQQNNNNNGSGNTTQQQNQIANNGQNGNTSSAANGSLPGWTYTDAPTYPPTPTPTSNTVSAAQRQLESFFYFWSANSYDNMLSLTLPSWQKGLASPQAELFGILVNRTPVAYQITKVSGTDNDTSRQITVLVEISKNNNSNKTELYSYQVLMAKENDVWYVDPRSLKSNEKESTPAPTNSMPTQPPDITSHPDLVLYYNPDGGTLYHVDPNCASAAKSYLPFKGSFTWSQINSGDYAKLKYCNTCNAPLRPQ